MIRTLLKYGAVAAAGYGFITHVLPRFWDYRADNDGGEPETADAQPGTPWGDPGTWGDRGDRQTTRVVPGAGGNS